MKPPVAPAEELEELAYVRSLVSEEISAVEAYFAKKYPNGYPFMTDAEDLRRLDEAEPLMVEKIRSGRARYSEWSDYDVA